MESSVSAQIISFLNKTGGRDKLYRTCQYGSRLVWWCIQETHRDPVLVKKLKGLDSHLSTSRKLLRIGKSVEFIRAAQKSVHLSDPFLQFAMTMANVNKASYLLVDHLLWLHRVGLVAIDAKHYGHVSSRFWLATLLLSLAVDLYALLNVLGTIRMDAQGQTCPSASAAAASPVGAHSNGSVRGADHAPTTSNGGCSRESSSGVSLRRILSLLIRYHLGLLLDTLKNLADLFLPLSYLNYINISSGLQGLLGVVSSIIGVLTVWDSKYKLKI